MAPFGSVWPRLSYAPNRPINRAVANPKANPPTQASANLLNASTILEKSEFVNIVKGVAPFGASSGDDLAGQLLWISYPRLGDMVIDVGHTLRHQLLAHRKGAVVTMGVKY